MRAPLWAALACGAAWVQLQRWLSARDLEDEIQLEAIRSLQAEEDAAAAASEATGYVAVLGHRLMQLIASSMWHLE